MTIPFINMHVIDFLFILLAFFVFIIGVVIMYKEAKNKDKKWEEIDPKNAIEVVYKGKDTPVKGEFLVRVSDWQWVGVKWDKRKGKEFLLIFRPPDISKHYEHYIHVFEKNWKVVEISPYEKVTVEEYFKRQVM